jgi:hypothetical protein
MTLVQLFAILVFSVAMGAPPPQRPPAGPGSVTDADLRMAGEVIRRHTMIMPGLNPGSRIENGPGPFSASDAVVLIALKYYESRRACASADALAATLHELQDQELHKKHALNWWVAFCAKPYNGDLRNRFDMYVLEKTTARTRRANRVLAGHVQAEEAWRRVMNSQTRRDQRKAGMEAAGRDARQQYLAQWDTEWSLEEARYSAWRESLIRTRAPTQ